MIVDRNGVPLAVKISPANYHDLRWLEATVDAIPALKGRRGRPRRRPKKLHADKAYDSRAARELLRRRGITPRLARRKVESSKRPGRHRWVVERTLAWLSRYRRLRIRYERCSRIHRAFLSLGCALIYWNFIEKWFC